MPTPPKFHLGQAVVCIKTTVKGPEHIPTAQKGEILHVTENYWAANFGKWFVVVREYPYPAAYLEDNLAPVEYASDDALAALLKDSLTPVTA